MCGIFAIVNASNLPSPVDVNAAAARAALLAHRGPDARGEYRGQGAFLVHYRLAIVDPHSGPQPLVRDDAAGGVLAVTFNGEIYNHDALREQAPAFSHVTQTDTETLLSAYERRGTDLVDDLDGVFAFVLHDEARGRTLVARDPLGVVPLYFGRGSNGEYHFASELKALVGFSTEISEFPPGHVWDSESLELRGYYKPRWRSPQTPPRAPAGIRAALEQAVQVRIPQDASFGCLLSGGLDSSLVSAIAQAELERREPGRRLRTFSIGLAGSPDLRAAQQVANAIGSEHETCHFTVEEGLGALADVIRHIETYDVTTVRASTPMFLLARRLRAAGIKVALTGEGADELFGGYLYFHKAPDAVAHHQECVRKLEALHMFDCLRANKSMAAWGVEARVPFLDGAFVDLAMGLNPSSKLCRDGRMEKHILREAFEGVLPEDILWRQKEQFSDGVGYGWIDGLKAHAECVVSDEERRLAWRRFPVNPPQTAEGYLYRAIFERAFPGRDAAQVVPSGPSIACSSPVAIAWDAAFAATADPSGRAVVDVHQSQRANVRP